MSSSSKKLKALVTPRPNAGVRYKFVQTWPKDGVFPQQKTSTTTPRSRPQRIASASELYKKRSAELLWQSNSRRCSSSVRSESSTCTEAPVAASAISRVNSPFVYSNKRILQRRQMKSQLMEVRADHNFHDTRHQVEVYHLPPMLLPAIHKSKAFDFKAMKRNKPPSPQIDPFFFSPRSRRRRAAVETRQSITLNKKPSLYIDRK